MQNCKEGTGTWVIRTIQNGVQLRPSVQGLNEHGRRGRYIYIKGKYIM